MLIIGRDDSKNNTIDDVISESIDELPDSVLDTLVGDIDTYCSNNDFQSLANCLHGKKVEYKRKQITIYNYAQVDFYVSIFGSQLMRILKKTQVIYEFVCDYIRGFTTTKMEFEQVLS